jgi:hypothetical protein
MLVAMDIPAAAGPWIALGVALGIVLLGLAGLGAALLLRRPPAAACPEETGDEAADDLATFLEHPPGFPGERRRPEEGWATLSAPPPASTAADAPGLPVPGRSLAALAVVALLLAGAAVAVAVGLADGDAHHRASAHESSRGRGEPPAAEGLEARLSFGGVVLERHAVGVTATYPELRLTGDRARLELPTYNCLAADAPTDPAAAGCRRTAPEYAELAAPDLRVTETGDGWRISGRFPTEIRPTGSGPTPTGRIYELVVTVVPGNRARHGWRAAEGTLRLGPDETATTGTDAAAGVNVLRSGGR